MDQRFALLNASHELEDAERNFRRELDADLDVFDVRDGERPPAIEGKPAGRSYDGFVVSGSPVSVTDDEPWIDDVERWVESALDAGLPGLGVCFGHQLLADVLGGTVEPMGEYEIGYHMVRHGPSPLFEGVDEWFVAYTAHSDEVVDLPPGAEALAENNFSTHAFRRGNAFGVQFHPEFDIETARTVFDYKDVDEARAKRVLEEMTTGTHAATTQAKTVFQNFESYVDEGTERRTVARPA